MKTNILLLGKNGQLGKEFMRYFEGKTNYFINAFSHEELDITDRNKLSFVAHQNSYHIIINCSAYNKVDLAETESKKAFAVNYLGVRNLAEMAKKLNSKLIHYSTDYVFGQKNRKLPYCVYDPPNPLSVYGESKYYGEKAICELHDKYLIIRVSWLFGDGVNFISQLLEWSNNNNKLDIINDQISSPTYTFDLVRATMKLLMEDVNGIFHITNSSVNKIKWAEYVLKKTKWNGEILGVNLDSINFKAYRPKYAILDNSLFENIVNWKMPEWKNATDRYLNSL